MKCHDLCTRINPYQSAKIAIINVVDGKVCIVVTQEDSSADSPHGLPGGHAEKNDEGCFYKNLTREYQEECADEKVVVDEEFMNAHLLRTKKGVLRGIRVQNKFIVLVYWEEYDIHLRNAMIERQWYSNEKAKREVKRLELVDIETGKTIDGDSIRLSHVAREIIDILSTLKVVI